MPSRATEAVPLTQEVDAPEPTSLAHDADSTPSDALRSRCHTREREYTALLQQIAAGDTTALATLYDATNTLVYSLAMRLVRDRQVAEDVTMEVYIQVQQQAGQYDPHRGTPSAWLVMLARSRALDRLRHESTRQLREAPLENAFAIPSSTPTPEEDGVTAELRQVIQTALATLTPEQRRIIEIAYYEGLSHSEIAAQLGQPLGTVKTRLRTGLMTLRTLLRPFILDT